MPAGKSSPARSSANWPGPESLMFASSAGSQHQALLVRQLTRQQRHVEGPDLAMSVARFTTSMPPSALKRWRSSIFGRRETTCAATTLGMPQEATQVGEQPALQLPVKEKEAPALGVGNITVPPLVIEQIRRNHPTQVAPRYGFQVPWSPRIDHRPVDLAGSAGQWSHQTGFSSC